MKPPSFEYSAPSTIAEAIELLTEHGEAEARVLAGGQSLVPLMNFRLAHPGYLVDLRRVPEIDTVRLDGEVLVIGAMARQSVVEDSPEVAVAAPLLAEAIGYVAHRPIRNSGTVGGSLAHADPAAELPLVALALDVELLAVGPAGSRSIPAGDFFRGPFTTALRPEELLVEVRVPRRTGGHAFVEFARTHGNFAIVAVATQLELEQGRISRATVALSGVAPTPIRAAAAEAALYGAPPDSSTIAAASEVAVEDLNPTGDLHASAATRIGAARTYVHRALELALARAQDGR